MVGMGVEQAKMAAAIAAREVDGDAVADLKPGDEDTKKYDKEMKEYLNEHNYKKSNDVSPKMIYQQINNSKNKISINELIANDIELKHKKRNNNVLNLKERAMIKKNNSINSINNSINECEKDFCKIVFNVYK